MQYLIARFGFDVADTLVGRYRIGTHSHWEGATVFWQLDAKGNLRTGKVMLYNKQTGKRVKQPHNHITWMHTLISKQFSVSSVQSSVGSGQFAVSSKESSANCPPQTANQQNSANCPPRTANFQASSANCQPQTANFKLRQCLFGEHLLPEAPHIPVAIVESEKTAIIASALMPAFTWLACGSLDGLNTDKCRILAGRKVMLFPDVNGYDKWLAKARQLQRENPALRIEVSAMLEQHATEENRKQGVDIADVVFGGF
ncbi:DUF6371 domain-containing protein [Mucilaginibacter pedocola]|uniref:DUF6371 domain-containing protein n=1 Tax=Mucilaginibacter pedocola TaxID=1792845 RepID=A0A1S9PDS8_9SPHI|nr:DUF6371 domain-containing protein [Mucilaginibacter pedocola]OOQ59116.1 hypothetical protein BC343_29275 [Mucilaginibacter pedocola]